MPVRYPIVLSLTCQPRYSCYKVDVEIEEVEYWSDQETQEMVGNADKLAGIASMPYDIIDSRCAHQDTQVVRLDGRPFIRMDSFFQPRSEEREHFSHTNQDCRGPTPARKLGESNRPNERTW